MADGPSALRFRIFGPLSVVRDDVGVTPTLPLQRAVLAALLAERGHFVDASDLLEVARQADGVHGRPTPSELHDALGHLDRVLLAGAGCTLTSDGRGWRLEVPPDSTDADELAAIVDTAPGAVTLAGSAAEAAALMRLRFVATTAAANPLADLRGSWADARREVLAGLACRAAVALARRCLAPGAGPRTVVEVLGPLTWRFRRSEELWAVYIDALDADGRPAEALAAARRALGSLPPDRPLAPALWTAVQRHLPTLPVPGPSGTGPAAPATDPQPEHWADIEYEVLRTVRARIPGLGGLDPEGYERRLLAALLLHHGRTVAYGRLADAVWGMGSDRPSDPAHALEVLAGPLGRRIDGISPLYRISPSMPGRRRIVATDGGLMLDVAARATDLGLAEEEAATGLAAFTAGDYRAAADRLHRVVDAVGEQPLPDVTGAWAEQARAGLLRWATDLRLVAADADLRTGRTTRAAEDLSVLAGHLPDRPDVVLALAEALQAEERVDEALDALDALETRLAAQGRAPDATLRDRRARLLAAPAAGSPAGAAVRLRFTVLGPLRVEVDAAEVGITDPVLRTVLAVLLLRHGRPVPLDELRQALRGRTVDEDVLAGWVVALRAVVSGHGPVGRFLRRVGDGLLLEVAPDALDLARAEVRVAGGAAAAARGDAASAASTFRDALDLLPAALLPGLEGQWFTAERGRIGAWRDEVVVACARAETAAGEPHRAAARLRPLADAAPAREDLWQLYLSALVAAGRTDQARQEYDRLAGVLEREVGTTPGPALVLLRRSMGGAS